MCQVKRMPLEVVIQLKLSNSLLDNKKYWKKPVSCLINQIVTKRSFNKTDQLIKFMYLNCLYKKLMKQIKFSPNHSNTFLWYCFIVPYKVVLTFASLDEVLKCDHWSNESYWAVRPRGTVYYAVQGSLWVKHPSMTIISNDCYQAVLCHGAVYYVVHSGWVLTLLEFRWEF